MVTTPSTPFTLDVTGRYVCNTLGEALASTDRTADADARPFDIIVIGGGTFGSAFACHLFNRDRTHAHRILVLEAGPMALPEHVQNLPMLSTNETWGVPWDSDSPKVWNQRFPGLAFNVGGRSLFWGGWSPYFLDSEMPSPPWPVGTKRDLTTPVLPPSAPDHSYLDDSARQIGTDTTNDFIQGALHGALRDRLFAGLQAPPADPATILTGKRGALGTADDLEAPLAVQSASPRPGFFPINKFSTVPLLISAARTAQSEAEQSVPGNATAAQRDVKKRFMLVDNTHVIRLERNGRQITRVVTNKGSVDVPPNGQVFIALGTIESTRLALNSLPNANGLIGRNLMAHLRSNVTFRVPRASFGDALDPAIHPEARNQEASALFVKGVHTHADGTLGHFHVQITAAGVGELGMDSEADLFKKIPDIDLLDNFRDLNVKWVICTLRGIGEIVGDKTSADPQNRITLDAGQGPYDYGQPRALVRLEAGPAGSKELVLWDAMDAACDELATVFANGGPIQYLSSQSGGVWQNTPPGPDARRDTLSSTHHEGGTLWMGDDPATSVTDEWGRFHEADNLSAIGPALLPTMGSPNPMLSGVALARRMADHALAGPPAVPVEPGFVSLFDGTQASFSGWQFAGQGAFALIDGALVAQPGGDIGLLFYALRPFGDFTLRLQFRLVDPNNDNSGVFVRFRSPRMPLPNGAPLPNNNQAFVGVETGFEVQIDELAHGNRTLVPPEADGLDMNRTGAIYKIPIGPNIGEQDYQRGPALRAGDWNDYQIEVAGDTYTVHLNGQQTTVFTNTDPNRGLSPDQDVHSGFIGLQTHTDRVAFRNIRIMEVAPAPAPPLVLPGMAMAGDAKEMAKTMAVNE